MFHNVDLESPERYGGWNWTMEEWDSPTAGSFWYNPNSTLLFGTNTYTIGETCPKLIRLSLQPERFVLKGQKVTQKIFGIPLDHEDDIISHVSSILKKLT